MKSGESVTFNSPLLGITTFPNKPLEEPFALSRAIWRHSEVRSRDKT